MMTTSAPPVPAEDLATYTQYRNALVRELSGTVLEIGAGSGANFGLLRPQVRWIGLEPSSRRRRELAAQVGTSALVLPDRAEDVPLPDRSVDAVLSTLTLCSVTDQDRCLQEIRRLLRPGGRFVFAEHVAAPDGTWTHRTQRLIAPLSRWLDHGCDPARRTWLAIERAGFADVELRWFRSHGRFAFPFIAGYAQI